MKAMMRLAALLLAAAAPTAAAAKWRQASSTHFVIYSEEDAGSLRAFADRLERYDSAMRFIRGLRDYDPGPANRLVVYVVPDVAAVRKLYARNAGNVAGFYLPRASGSIAIVPRRTVSDGDFDAENILRHEYAHHFMFENYAAAFPSWFIEGFAEFHATSEFEKDGSVGIGRPAAHRAYGLFNANVLPVDKMMALSTERLSREQTEAIYGRGWLLTHYLTFNDVRRPQLARYLEALNGGKSSAEAAAAAFGDLKSLEQEVGKYLMRKRMSYMHIPPDKLKAGPIEVRELSPGEDAVMELKIRSRRGVDEAAARALLPLMRKAAAPYPNDPAVQATLAEAEYDADNYKEAIAAADRALAVDPRSVDALSYKGRATLALALAGDPSAKAKGVNEARRIFASANRIDPDDPEPLMLFYTSYAASGTQPTANSVVGLNRAFELAPQDRGLRMMAARQALVDGKAPEARRMLAPIAFDPHAGGMGAAAAAIVATLDKDGAAAALGRFDAAEEEEKKAESGPS